MKNLIPLVLAVFYLCSCDPSSQVKAQDITQQLLYEIAGDKAYFEYRKALRNNTEMIRKRDYDQDGITKYMAENHKTDPDFCKIDFSEVQVMGIQKYMDGICRLNSSMNTLKNKYPQYESLDKSQLKRLKSIFKKDYGFLLDKNLKPKSIHNKN